MYQVFLFALCHSAEVLGLVGWHCLQTFGQVFPSQTEELWEWEEAFLSMMDRLSL